MSVPSPETKRRFGGPSGKPKVAKKRGQTVASRKEMAARKAHEDYKEARRLAEEFDLPCSISEFS